MGKQNIYDISVTLGVCPECLIDKINKLGIDTFSSLETLKKLIEFDKMEAGSIPATHNDSWVYFCEECWEKEENTRQDNEVEIKDCIV